MGQGRVRASPSKPESGCYDFKRTVIVAMVAMLMVQASIDQVIGMVAMRDCLVAATQSMNVAGNMTDVILERAATLGIGCGHFDDMFIDMVPMRMMEVSIMKIIDMITMLHGDMAAACAVLVIVMVVVREIAVAHGFFLFVVNGVRRRDRSHCRSGPERGCRQ